jgi:hypothetical protein
MGRKCIFAFVGMNAVLVLSGVWSAWGQGLTDAGAVSNVQDNRVALLAGHPFSAIKYARKVRALPDSKLQFITNERYPIRIARDANGRLMMQDIHSDDLQSECDHLELRVPPLCPAWSVFVIDPVAHTIANWAAGELGAHMWMDFPLSDARLEETVHATADLPDVPPDFSDEDGKMSKVNLGNRTIEGIPVHGMRWTLLYDTNQDGQTIQRTRIHEVWTSAEMKLIVRVVDGDPHGVESVWGLKKISLSPDPALFQPPADYQFLHCYQVHRSNCDKFTDHEFEYLASWFSK